MKIAIIGLGLIGGSMAKSIKGSTDHTVFGYDLNDTVVKKAQLLSAIDAPLTDAILAECDLTIVALYPQASIDFVTENRIYSRKVLSFWIAAVSNRRSARPSNRFPLQRISSSSAVTQWPVWNTPVLITQLLHFSMMHQ